MSDVLASDRLGSRAHDRALEVPSLAPAVSSSATSISAPATGCSRTTRIADFLEEGGAGARTVAGCNSALDPYSVDSHARARCFDQAREAFVALAIAQTFEVPPKITSY